MVKISPYLQLLLSKRRPEELPPDDVRSPVLDGPTIPIRPRTPSQLNPDPGNPDPGFQPRPTAPGPPALSQGPGIALRPRRTYNTTLPSDEEQAFNAWKQQNAPNDSGDDYDLRGAFKSGATPDPTTSHWPDTFKKPNHPTFSNQSQYAVGSDAAQAGSWRGDSYIPPAQESTIAIRPRITQTPGKEPTASSVEGMTPRPDGSLPIPDPRTGGTPLAMNERQPLGSADYPAGPPTISLLPRTVNVDASASEAPLYNGRPMLAERVSASNEPFGTRPRRTQTLSPVEEAAQRVRDLEANPKKQSKAKRILEELAVYGAGGFGLNLRPLLHPRGSEEQRANRTLARELALERGQSEIRTANAGAYGKLNKPPEGSTRIVGEEEYPDLLAGTEIRQVWNGSEMVDALRNGKPVVSKGPAAEKAAAREIKYNNKGEAMLVPKDGGRAMPIFDQDGKPLTRQASESGNVQTAYRLAPDGITQIQIERDDETEQWVDSIGRDKKPIVRGTAVRIDPVSGAPVSSLITNDRLTDNEDRTTAKDRQENQRKRRSYENEVSEWGGKETTFRQNKSAEDEAIRTKTERLQALYQETTGGYISNRGGRAQKDIDTDKARLLKEIETHRTNADRFQTEADKAASSATEARRNAGLYTDSGGPQGVIGRARASDGQRHYTKAEIRAIAESYGKSYESLYQKLKSDKRVVIDE